MTSDQKLNQPTTLQRATSGRLGGISWRALLAQDVRAGALPGLVLVGFLVAAFIGQWFMGGPEQLGLSRQAVSEGRWLTLATHAVTHGGHLHLWMNSAAILSMTLPVRLLVGSGAEGWWRYLSLLVGAAILSAGMFLLIHPNDGIPMVGASGAICGLWGLLVRSDLETRRLRPLLSKPVMIGMGEFAITNGVLFAILFFAARSTGSQGGLAWEAHLGGFLFGLLLAPLFVRRLSLSEPAATS